MLPGNWWGGYSCLVVINCLYVFVCHVWQCLKYQSIVICLGFNTM